MKKKTKGPNLNTNLDNFPSKHNPLSIKKYKEMCSLIKFRQSCNSDPSFLVLQTTQRGSSILTT